MGAVVVIAFALSWIEGCGGDGPTEPAGSATQLVAAGGDRQVWYFGNALPAPYTVVALDANGRGVPGVEISWTVTSGGGSIEPGVSSTGSDGMTAATHTLGPIEATQTVTASAAGLSVDIGEVEFSASAADPPTSASVSLEGSSFDPENVVVQVGGTVTWTWAEPVDHNVIFVSGPSPRPADSPTLNAGTYDVTFTTAAAFQYVCTIHSGMDGTVRVVN